MIYKESCNKFGGRANSRLGESVSDLNRAKIRLGEFKAVYSIYNQSIFVQVKMQEQISEQRRQQEWLMNARNLNAMPGAVNHPNFPPQQLPNAAMKLQNPNIGFNSQVATSQASVPQNESMWARMPRMRLSNVFRKMNDESLNSSRTEAAPQPKMKTEFSFMPKATTGQNQVRHFGTDMDDAPTKRSAWYGDNLVRRPLRSAHSISYSPLASPDMGSLKSKVMSAFGMRGGANLPPGIRNEGQNLCFMNSILQCVARTPGLLPELRKAASSDSDCSVAESLLLSTFVEILVSCASEQGSGKSVLDPMAFRQSAATLRPDLVALPTQRQSQQDSAEFFMWLMDSIHTVLNKNWKAKGTG